jgi:L-glutamine-phosphate cytidylyltransferase
LKAIILSAGQGKRLLPLTAERPKCLLSIAGRSLLEWQIRALADGGLSEAVVVTGFASSAVEDAAASLSSAAFSVRTVFNPFFKVADNIGSCFVARHEMDSDFVLLNGDTLIEPAIVAQVLADSVAPVSVTIDRKTRYDDDDMKVTLDGRRLTAIGKSLPLDTVDAESIGLLRFRGRGAGLFQRGIDRVLRQPDGLGRFYLSVINELAETGQVGTVDIAGCRWSEVDYPVDLARAEELAAGWWARDWARITSDLPATG